MPLYETVSIDEFNRLRMPNQTRLYNMLSRNNGGSTGESGDDNFFVKRGKSLENAFGTTGATIAAGINEEIERNKNKERGERFDKSMQDIYRNAGYNSVDDYYNAKEAAEKDAFGRIGFDIDSYWDNRANADIAGDKDTVARLDQEYNAAKAQIGNDEALAKFDEIQNQLKAQSSANYNEAKKAAEDYADYRQNSYIGQKTNQDRGKFAGSAINTLSTMFDVMAPGAGVLANSLQGGIEGIADELEQNGLENFDWNRAGQNALTGATVGAVTGGLNKGISSKLAKNGGNLFKGGNAITRGLNNLGSSTATGRIGSTLATGAARGAISGAAGGAVGGGLSAAMNGGDVIGSAIEGAQRGAGQGAFAGGTMAGINMAASRLPGVGTAMQKFNEAGEDWNARKANGESFGERLANTWDESPTKKYLSSTKKGYIQLPFSEDRTPGTQAETDIINIRNQNMDTVRRMTNLDDGISTTKRDLENNPQLARLINEGKLVEVKDGEGWDGIGREPMPRYTINEDVMWTDKDISDMADFYNNEEYGYVDKNGRYYPEEEMVLRDTSLSPNQTSIFDDNAKLQGQTGRFNAPEDWTGNQKTLTAQAEKILSNWDDSLVDGVPAHRIANNQGKVSLGYGETVSARNEAIADLRANFNDNDLAFLFTKANTPRTRALIHDAIDSPEIKVRLADWAGENPIQGTVAKAAEPTTSTATQIKTTDGYTAQDLINMASSQRDQFVDDVRAITAENNGIPNEAFFDTAVKTNIDRINQKITDKGGKAPTDILRSTIMVTDPNGSVDRIIKSFEDRGYKIYNNDITNRYTDGSTGYKDIALKFVKGDNDNIVKEIQIMTPNMQKAKYELGGHELYEKVRSKVPDWEKYEAEMNQLYADAERADAAALNSASDTSRPSFNALNGENSRPDQVYPATSSSSRTTLTGTPSTMKNLGNSLDVINDSPFNSSIAQKTKIVNAPETELFRIMNKDQVAMQDTRTPETEVYRATEIDNKPFMAYGESDLANKTKRNMLADSLERFGNTLEGAQTNVTRAARKDIGVKNAGEVIEKVRKVTGLTNMETQAQLARELTGDSNSLMDRVQNNAIYTREDGTPYRVDTTPVIEEVENIVNKYADSNTFGSQKAKDQFIYNLKKDISNENADVLGVANRMKANAADLRGKGVGEVPAKDKAQAKIYSDIAKKLDDLSYSVIPQENVDAMFDATINEMRARAVQAANNNNRSVANAYTALADNLDAQPRTVQAFRSFKKPFVDVAKIDDLSAMAENGAAAQMGRSFGGGIKRFANVVAQRPVNALLAKAGGKVNSFADRLSGDSTTINSKYGGWVDGGGGQLSLPSGEGYTPSTRIYDMIGRTEGLTNAEQARTADYLVNAAQEAEIVPNVPSAGTLDSMISPTSSANTSVYNSLYGNNNQATTMQSQTQSGSSYFPMTGDYWTDIIARAMTAAIDADDVNAFASLYGMYQDSLANLKKNTGKNYNDVTNWNSSDRTKLLSAQDALGQIDELESAYNSATGGSGGNVLQGNLRSLAANISGGNLDPSANNYNKLAESVGMGIVKNLINLGVTEADAKRYLEYLPALTDTKEQAAQKLSTLRNIYQTQINNLRSVYEV